MTHLQRPYLSSLNNEIFHGSGLQETSSIISQLGRQIGNPRNKRYQ